jgi:hypothetical protein
MEISFHPHLPSLPFHFATTQQHGADEEGRCRRCLGPSSWGDHLHGHHQGRWDIGETAQRPSWLMMVQHGNEESIFESRHRQSLQPRASLPVDSFRRCWHTRHIPPYHRLVARCEQREVLFIKGMGDICTGCPGGAALLAWAEEKGDLQAAYILAIIKYYKHGTTEDVFIHIRHVYGEVTSDSQVGGWWWMEDGAYDEDDARVARVHNQISA